MQKYFKTVDAGNRNILSWKSKGLSDEIIKAPATSNKILKSYTHRKIANIYIVYEIEESVDITNYPTLEGAVKLTKHVDVDLYKYSGHGIGFDRKGCFSISDEIGRNAITFIDNKEKTF